MRRLLVLAVALAVTPAAGAATLSIAITGTSVVAPGITLTGIDQTKTFTIAAAVAYTNSGNTLGWKVNASSTTLTSGTNTLPALVVTGVTEGGCSGFRCVAPTNSVTWPVPLSTTPAKIYNAAAGTGKGTVTLTGTYQVTYPANALPGTYTATVTLSTATGP